ncbi:MAG: hypothetical protein COA97_13045 [Flavobacteriales bacterium]|nr:MAG: hypothetical protein COA97_13045 [Flavobacteriales bacterium]
MKKIILILFILVSFKSYSCRCANGGLKLNEYSKSADIAFKGKIISEQTIDRFHYYKVRIEKLYKGNLTSELIEIRTLARTSCQFGMGIGEEYFIFASLYSDNTYITGECSGTQLFNTEKELELKQ